MISLPPHTYKRFIIANALITLLICLVGLFLRDTRFIFGLISATVFSAFVFLSMARNIENLFNAKAGTFLLPGFIFRLACFAIFLYVILARLHLSLVGVLVGIMVPIVSFTVAMLYTLKYDPEGF